MEVSTAHSAALEVQMAPGIRTWLIQRLIPIQTIALVLVFIGIVVHGYNGRIWSEVQSFKVIDDWCHLKSQGLGRHCFGDFGLPYYRGLRPSPYMTNNFAAANTPLTAMMFEFLRLFSYNVALTFYLLLLALCIAIPFFLVSTEVSFESRIQLAVLFGLISAGAISAIDRGNHITMFVPLLVGYVVAIRRERWKWALAILVLLSMLKFWGILFAVALVARARWRDAAVACLATATFSLLLMTSFPGPLSMSLRSMFQMAGNRGYANAIAGYSVSIHGLIRRAVCAATTSGWCNSQVQGRTFVASPIVSLLITGLLLTISLVLIRSRRVPDHIWIAVLISLGFLAVPEAPIYNLCLVSAIVVLILSLEDVPLDKEWRRSTFGLMAALVMSSTPITFISNRPTRFATGTDVVPILFRSDFWVIPTAWLVFVVLVLCDFMSSRSFENNEK